MSYAAGQKVAYKGMEMPAKVISGPRKSNGAPRWLIEKADGNITLAPEQMLTALPELRDKVAEALFVKLSGHGRSMSFSAIPESGQRTYLSMADLAIAAVKEHQDAEPSPRPLAVGDRIRILKDNHQMANVRKGEVLSVTKLTLLSLRVKASKSPHGYWTFLRSAEGIGWERV